MRCVAPILGKGSTRGDPRWVPCGICGYCLINKQQDWEIRLGEEYKHSPWTWFITPTYNEQAIPWTLQDKPLLRTHFGEHLNVTTLYKPHMQAYIKRLRKANEKYTDLQLRYYLCGEYGERYGRPHYHIIAFNLHPATILKHVAPLWYTDDPQHPAGIIEASLVQSMEDVSNYVASYIVQAHHGKKSIYQRPFSLMSRRPFLGHQYLAKHGQRLKERGLPYLERGPVHKQRIPRIYKDKIFEQWEKNTWKQPFVEQTRAKEEAELHRLRLLNGDEWDGFQYLDQQKFYHEAYIRNHAKKSNRL